MDWTGNLISAGRNGSGSGSGSGGLELGLVWRLPVYNKKNIFTTSSGAAAAATDIDIDGNGGCCCCCCNICDVICFFKSN